MSNTTTTKGQGVMQVSALLWDDLGKPVTPEEWHKALLLPDAYEVERVASPENALWQSDSLMYHSCYTLYVNHEAIPVVVGASRLPIVTPNYSVDYHEGQRSQPYITRIEITQWDGSAWQKIAVTDEKES